MCPHPAEGAPRPRASARTDNSRIARLGECTTRTAAVLPDLEAECLGTAQTEQAVGTEQVATAVRERTGSASPAGAVAEARGGPPSRDPDQANRPQRNHADNSICIHATMYTQPGSLAAKIPLEGAFSSRPNWVMPDLGSRYEGVCHLQPTAVAAGTSARRSEIIRPLAAGVQQARIPYRIPQSLDVFVRLPS